MTTRVWDEKRTLVLILALALAVRLYGIGRPLLGSNHQRETLTAENARHFYNDGMNLLMPAQDDTGAGPGYEVLEFPLLQGIAAGLYFVFGEHEVLGRLVAIAFSLGAVFYTFRLSRKFLASGPSFVAAAVCALSPAGIYLGRSYMPDASMLCFATGAGYYFLDWLDHGGARRFTLAAAFVALTILAKTTAALILLPLLFAWLGQYGWKGVVRPKAIGFALASLILPALWTLHADRVDAQWCPALRPLSFIAARSGDAGYRLDPIIYAKLVAYWGGFLLGPLAAVLACIGLFVKQARARGMFLHGWVLGWFIVLTVLTKQFATHPYYMLPGLPPFAVLAGFGAAFLYEKRSWLNASRLRLGVATSVLVFFVLAQVGASAYFACDLYDVHKRLPYHPEVARILRERTAPGSVLILNDLNECNTTLTYYARRKAWTFQIPPGEEAVTRLEALRAQGASAYVAVDSRYYERVRETRENTFLWEHLKLRYRTIAVSDHYVIYDLTRAPDGNPPS